MNIPSRSVPRVCAALLVGALVSALASSLASPVSAAESAKPPVAAPPFATAAALVAPSEADCAAFGRQLAALLDAGNAEAAIQQLDQFALLDRIATGLDFSARDERDFHAGLLNTLPASFKQQFANFSAAHFLRVQTVGAQRRALLRLTSDDGAASYMAFICTRRGTGPVRWADVFLYISGETISESTRRTVLPLLAQGKKGFLERLTGTDSAMVLHFSTVQRATKHLQNGKLIEAWAEFEKLPEELKRDRTVLLLRMRLAQAIDETKYLRVIDQWRTAFPGDPTLDFISVDGAIMRKDYPAALAHADAFAKQIGGDAYLDCLAANILIMSERYADARTRARAALAVEPKLASAFDALLTVSLKTRNYPETIAVLEELRALFPAIELATVAADEAYAEFRLSRTYLDWSARQKAPLPATP